MSRLPPKGTPEITSPITHLVNLLYRALFQTFPLLIIFTLMSVLCELLLFTPFPLSLRSDSESEQGKKVSEYIPQKNCQLRLPRSVQAHKFGKAALQSLLK